MNKLKNHALNIKRLVLTGTRRQTGFLTSLFIYGLFLLASSPVLAGDIETLREILKTSLPNTEIRHLRESPVPGLFEMLANENLMYVDRDGNHLIFGPIYDLSTYKDLSAERLAELDQAHREEKTVDIPTYFIPWGSLPRGAAIVENAGGKYRLAIFTDINCPHCKRLGKLLAQMPDVEVHTYLVSLWPQSVAPSKAVLCAQDKVAALHAAFGKTPPNTAASCASGALDRNNAFALFHEFTGTPFLVRSDGRTLSGVRSRAFLLDWLKKAKH
ncbi:MAG: DsbC family protein [bacterium]|nr:DsbC family protein [bacterium]